MKIIDTHLHLIYRDRFSYPWIAGKPLDRDWTAEQYWAEATILGIETALHMEVDVAEKDMRAETEFVLELPQVVGAIAACRPESADFPRHLERLAAMPSVKGLRRILHEVPDEVSRPELFAENIRRLAEHDLSFDLCLRADQLHLGLALARKAPEVRFILDHCGNPDVAHDGLDPWREDIKCLAELPNVSAKMSGIVTNARADWTVETIRPYVEHLIGSFGWDRVVWGSDHPVVTLNGSLTRWVEASLELVRGASADEQAQLFHRNAARIYRI